MSAITKSYGQNIFAAILSHNISIGQLNVLCSRLRRAHHLGSMVPATTRAELDALWEAVCDIEPEVQPSHFASGMKYLRNILYTPKGNERVTDRAAQFRGRDKILLDHATSIRVYNIEEQVFGSYGQTRFLPQYAVRGVCPAGFDDDGNELTEPMEMVYEMLPWQSGDHFEITRHA